MSEILAALGALKEGLFPDNRFIYNARRLRELRSAVGEHGLVVFDLNGVLTTNHEPFLPNTSLIPFIDNLKRQGVSLWVWTTACSHQAVKSFVDKHFPQIEHVVALNDYKFQPLQESDHRKKGDYSAAVRSAGWLTEDEQTALISFSPLKSPEIFTRGPIVIVEDGHPPLFHNLYQNLTEPVALRKHPYYYFPMEPFGPDRIISRETYLPLDDKGKEVILSKLRQN